VRRETIAMIWIGGLVLAVALYLVGPDNFIAATLALMNGIDTLFRSLVYNLGAQVYGVVRAAAIAIYIVFVILAFLSVQRGRRGVWALILVTGAFLFLVWHGPGEPPAAPGRWIIALALVIIGALTMTQRLLAQPHQRQPIPPYPMGPPR
jgi:hypothetical protein